MATILAIGTVKGLFVFRAEHGAGSFKLQAQHLPGWEVSSVLVRPRDGTLDLIAGTTHYAYGAVLRRSRDGGATWEQPDARPAHAEGSEYKTNRIWQLTEDPHAPNTLYAGIDEAALFKSTDDAASWREVSSLTDRESRKSWMPGGGGLCLHTIVHDHSNPNRKWLGISAVGVFRTDDGGATWTPRNEGLSSVATGSDEPEAVYCIHKIVQHPTDANRLFMQFHGGVFISTDGGDQWQRRESGLPSNFGFPIVCTRSGRLLVMPLEKDERRYFPGGHLAVFASDDQGASWSESSKGLPATPTYDSVLRDAMTSLGEGVYFGTIGGSVFATDDAGNQWHTIDASLPRVLCVRAIETA